MPRHAGLFLHWKTSHWFI